jgi:hypothetical protein
MDFTRFKDINQFYSETGMSRQEAFHFLLSELEKTRNELEKTRSESK